MKTEIDTIIKRSHQAFQNWQEVPWTKRQKYILQLSELLTERRDQYAEIITREMNKPITQSRAEIEKCAGLCRYYAEMDAVLTPEEVNLGDKKAKIIHAPLGTILGIMPWNFPFWQALRFAVPTILAGNTIVLKHASICEDSGRAMQQLFLDAGFPPHLFSFEKLSHEDAAALLAQDQIQGVSLTGSEAAGRKIAAAAGENLKKSVLELGGNDAFIVLLDADLHRAAKDAAQARLQNCGQTCVAGKRFIITDAVWDAFLPLFIEEYKKYIPADPSLEDTNLGYMARPDLADDLFSQYERAVEHGAEILLPLKRLTDIAVQPGMLLMNEGNPVLDEELFGPLAMVIRAKDAQDALQIANNTSFGLANAVYTQDKAMIKLFTEKLESGSVAVNQVFHSDFRLPFGGAKNSGYGVEMSQYTLHEFTLKKTIML